MRRLEGRLEESFTSITGEGGDGSNDANVQYSELCFMGHLVRDILPF
jgi:hypothetical protein